MMFIKELIELAFCIAAIGVSLTLFILSIESIIDDNDKDTVKYTAINVCVVVVWYFLIIK